MNITRKAVDKKTQGASLVALLIVVGIVLGSVQLIFDPIGLRNTGLPGAESSLENASPTPRDSTNRFIGFASFSAEKLNVMHQGWQLRHIIYVQADEVSTGPSVVSVNVIDNYTWAAAALSDQNGRCYVILVRIDPHNASYGSTRYGWLPVGSKCVGYSATAFTANERLWPDQR